MVFEGVVFEIFFEEFGCVIELLDVEVECYECIVFCGVGEEVVCLGVFDGDDGV